MMRNAILLASAAAFMAITVEARSESFLELPNIFERGDLKHCEDNGVVQSWCDSSKNPELECVMLPGFDQYGCSCHGHPYLCPTDCVGGKQADQKMHYGIQCLGIPQDEPNYVLYEVSRIVVSFSILWNIGYGVWTPASCWSIRLTAVQLASFRPMNQITARTMRSFPAGVMTI
jgi:hypothetical protein